MVQNIILELKRIKKIRKEIQNLSNEPVTISGHKKTKKILQRKLNNNNNINVIEK